MCVIYSVVSLKIDEKVGVPLLSFPRKRESRIFKFPGFRLSRAPARSAGMTFEL
jgi:hypothetical protein